MRISRRHCLAILGLHASCGGPSRSPVVSAIDHPDHARLHLRRTTTPINAPVTKLGGLPAWVNGPAWPSSRRLGTPMLFIGQITVEPALFNVSPGRIAYIFITADPRIDNTWEPHGGENAVIVQQSHPTRAAESSHGPKLQETIIRNGKSISIDVELEATLEFRADPERIEVPRGPLSQAAREALSYRLAASHQKIGGSPDWEQTGNGVPKDFRLLLQLSNYPITLDGGPANQRLLSPSYNFGTGTGYVMINPAATTGVLLWECT